MKYLKIYAKLYKKAEALKEILSDLKPLAQKELKRCPDGKTIVTDVEFHMTTKTTNEYSDEVKSRIEALRAEAKESGKVKVKETESFDAYIPKSAKETVLAKSSTDYRKHFGVKA